MKIDITLNAFEARQICAARIKNEMNLSPSDELNVTVNGVSAGATGYRVDHPHDSIIALCSVRYGLGDLNGTIAPGSKIEAIKLLRNLFVTNHSTPSPICLADSKTAIELGMNTVIAYILTYRTLNGIANYVRSFDP